MSDSLHVVCPHCDTVNRVPMARLGEHGKCGRCGGRLFEGRPLALDEERFARHAGSSDVPLLVDFWAAWCGPCRAMVPVFERAAAELEPRFRLVKIDTDAAPQLAGRLRIISIPTLMLVHHGREVARTAGAMPLPPLLEWARQHAPAATAGSPSA
jgi:thioredoxin 2